MKPYSVMIPKCGCGGFVIPNGKRCRRCIETDNKARAENQARLRAKLAARKG